MPSPRRPPHDDVARQFEVFEHHLGQRAHGNVKTGPGSLTLTELHRVLDGPEDVVASGGE